MQEHILHVIRGCSTCDTWLQYMLIISLDLAVSFANSTCFTCLICLLLIRLGIKGHTCFLLETVSSKADYRLKEFI